MPKNKQETKFTKRFWVLIAILFLCIGARVFYSINEHQLEIADKKAKVQYDVDLVYLWCDGNEPKFRERKNYWLRKENKRLDRQATAVGRFEQVDELKYSLRSAEEYLPWIHHIYIVTDRQVPTWLNTQNPKLTIVDHSEIIPKQYIPVFNSTAIETSIYKIPNLSEHFLLANDDTFVNRPLTKNFFFQQGMPIIRLKPGSVVNANSLYRDQLLNAIELSEQYFGSSLPLFSTRDFVPHHNIDAYLKSDYAACANQFEKEYQETLTHRFRRADDIQRLVVDIWSVMHEHAQVRIVFPSSNNPRGIDSLMISNTTKDYGGLLARRNPGLFCLNDSEFSTPEDRLRVKEFLEKRFPKKSEFEL